ncbi:MAG TPA: hypothetical protein VKU00_15860 [Chthonomonadaceae bacterium]|nr:hypothetical protein [Chthonomonadaceae bacterium]
MSQTHTDRTPQDVLAQLRSDYPKSPFLALGQTVFWDEPVKAVLRRLLDQHHLGGEMVIGVHDTDYFAKTRVRRAGSGRFVLLPHNDGTTRDLWSAAGEISALFGNESFPTRHDFVRYGAAFERIAAVSPEGRQAFLDAITEAWGWRGLVYTGSRDLIVHRLPLREVGDGILEMLTWAFENTLPQIAPGCCQGEARLIAEQILEWCQEFRAAHPEQHLTHLFQYVLPKLYTLLLGHEPEHTRVDGTAHLLLLNPQSAGLPRFRFVDLFLQPATRQIAMNAYNQAVAGSTIYTLDKFGAGALPFDIVHPERGRGTLRVTDRVLFVETRQPVAIGLKQPITSIQDLAEILTRKLGDHVTLVGKAVTLVSMLAQEFIFVFNEEGSLYVKRTRQMNDTLRQHGIALDMRPILRVRYHTWDSLTVGKSTLRLVPHLEAAFGRQTITTPEFASSWKQVVEEQRHLCTRLAALRKPLDLLGFLQERDPVSPWEERIAEYRDAKQTLLELRQQGAALQAEVSRCYEMLRELRRASLEVQTQQGEHFRNTRAWTPEATAQRRRYVVLKEQTAQAKRTLLARINRLKSQRLQLERGSEALEARATLRRIEDQAELARLTMLRNALLTTEGLTHTNHRPSAWWLPMLDTTGDWFRRVVETTELYTEPLLS